MCTVLAPALPVDVFSFLITYLVAALQVHSESLWVHLQNPSLSTPPLHDHHRLRLSPPAHPSPPLLVVLSGAVNEKDWTDTIGRRRAR